MSYIWPSGTFGLPRPNLGCPQSNGFDWKLGWRYQDTEDTSNNNGFSESFHLDASNGENGVNRSFCIKEENTSKEKERMWPKGEKQWIRANDISKQKLITEISF